MTYWAIVPVKPLQFGKSRLADVLSEDKRAQLNRHFLSRTLETLNLIPEIERVLVVSRDTKALALARKLGARTVREDGAPHLNLALTRATIVAQNLSAHGVIIIPADLPMIKKEDIYEIINAGKKPPVIVLSPDRRHEGTNAIFSNPAGLLEYDFGPGSFARHCERAKKTNARLVVVDIPSIALDVDLPEDLELIKDFL